MTTTIREATFKVLLYISLLCSFVFLFILSQFTPLWADDYTASLHYDSFWQFLVIQKRIYFGWTGRFSPLFINYLLLAKGFTSLKLINFLNGLIFTLLIYGIFLNSHLRKPRYLQDIAVLVFIFSLIWIYTPFFAEVVLWKTGTMFYLWPTVANLYFVYPFIQLSNGNVIFKDGLASKIGLFLCGLLVAGAMEYVSAALSFMLLCFLLFRWVKKEQLPKWSWFAAVGYWIGTVLLVIAPGNYVRRGVVVNTPFSLKTRIIEIYNSVYAHYVGSNRLLIIAAIVGVIVLLLNCPYRNIFVRHVNFFFSFFLLSAFALIGTPVFFEGRVTFASDMFFITAIVSFLFVLQSKYKSIIYTIGSLLLLIYIFPSLSNAYQEQKNIWSQTKAREQLINFYHQKNITTAFLSPYFYGNNKSNYNRNGINTQYLYLADISSDFNSTVNSVFCSYYGFKKSVLMENVILPWRFISSQINSNKNGSQTFLKDGYLYYVMLGNDCTKMPKNEIFSPWSKKYEVLTISDNGDIYSDRCVLRKKTNGCGVAHSVTG